MPAVLEQGINPLVQLQHVNVRIDDRDILKNIDFSLQEKEINVFLPFYMNLII